ncbi:MAG: hypothetical protein M0R20_01405 [Candidatus Omnitrophica bacterium]|nr:hypothetical protein [Candidatus Omnitrophota bacterium]
MSEANDEGSPKGKPYPGSHCIFTNHFAAQFLGGVLVFRGGVKNIYLDGICRINNIFYEFFDPKRFFRKGLLGKWFYEGRLHDSRSTLREDN